ncbi:ZIP family metal transporter [Mycoplasma sp. P36-A1]|uniref:ZIP family metal transporter n=1 Tax=Mycoplasma sp. P36-A1 TaxID=3252900 RepID=UPI003C307876
MSNEIYGLIYSTLAGCAMIVGALFSLLFKDKLKSYTHLSLGFSAGIMIYASLMEVLPHGIEHLSDSLGSSFGGVMAMFALLCGVIIAHLLDRYLPHSHEHAHINSNNENDDNSHILRLGVITAVTIAVHNLLEGSAVYLSFISEFDTGIALMMSVAIHNFPVGIAIALPIYYASKKPLKALGITTLSALATGLGAVLTHVFLKPYLTDNILGFIFALVSGMMIYIAFDELLPTANKYGDRHKVVYGVIAGMIVMGLALVLFSHGVHNH